MLSEAQTLPVLGRSARLFEQEFEDIHNAISDAVVRLFDFRSWVNRCGRWRESPALDQKFCIW